MSRNRTQVESLKCEASIPAVENSIVPVIAERAGFEDTEYLMAREREGRRKSIQVGSHWRLQN